MNEAYEEIKDEGRRRQYKAKVLRDQRVSMEQTIHQAFQAACMQLDHQVFEHFRSIFNSLGNEVQLMMLDRGLGHEAAFHAAEVLQRFQVKMYWAQAHNYPYGVVLFGGRPRPVAKAKSYLTQRFQDLHLLPPIDGCVVIVPQECVRAIWYDQHLHPYFCQKLISLAAPDRLAIGKDAFLFEVIQQLQQLTYWQAYVLLPNSQLLNHQQFLQYWSSRM